MKKAAIIVGICLTLVISVLSPALPLGEIWTAIDQYWKVWEKDRDLSRARAILPILEQACQDHPDKADLFSTRIFVLTQLKRDGDAIRLGGESFARFPQHRWVAAHYKNALINAGWREVERTNKAAAAQHFALAWRHWPDDPDVVNAWGYALYDHHGRPADAIAILEPALRRHQQHRWLPQTLAWSWYKHGDQLLAAGQTNSASAAWDLFWKTIGPDNPHAHMSYLWKLYALGRYQDAQPVIADALKRTGMTDDLYRCIYWLTSEQIDRLRSARPAMQGREDVIAIYRQLYQHAASREREWERGITYRHLAAMKAYHQLNEDHDSICPYWKPYSPGEQAAARRILARLEQGLPPELEFVVRNFRGQVLYREGRFGETAREMTALVAVAARLPWAGRMGYTQSVVVPFPVRGICQVTSRHSPRYITHMGLNRECYDIWGADSAGRWIPEGAERTRNESWYGFGREIIAVVDGVVETAVGQYPDDPPESTVLGPKGNHVVIVDNAGRKYNYYHLRQNSVRVRAGQRVRRGEVIALLGNSSSTSAHLHFGVYSPDWLVSLPVFFERYHVIKNGIRSEIVRGQPAGNGSDDIVEARQ